MMDLDDILVSEIRISEAPNENHGEGGNPLNVQCQEGMLGITNSLHLEPNARNDTSFEGESCVLHIIVNTKHLCIGPPERDNEVRGNGKGSSLLALYSEIEHLQTLCK